MVEEHDIVERCYEKLDVDMNEYLTKAEGYGYNNANTIPRISAYLSAKSAKVLEDSAKRMEQISAEAKIQADRMEKQGEKMLTMTHWLIAFTIALFILAIIQIVTVYMSHLRVESAHTVATNYSMAANTTCHPRESGDTVNFETRFDSPWIPAFGLYAIYF